MNSDADALRSRYWDLYYQTGAEPWLENLFFESLQCQNPSFAAPVARYVTVCPVVQHCHCRYPETFPEAFHMCKKCHRSASHKPQCKGFLFPSNGGTRGVDLIKSLFLEIVLAFVELIETGNTCATGSSGLNVLELTIRRQML